MKPSQFNYIKFNGLIVSEYYKQYIIHQKLAHKFNAESCIAQGETLLRWPLKLVKFTDYSNTLVTQC